MRSEEHFQNERTFQWKVGLDKPTTQEIYFHLEHNNIYSQCQRRVTMHKFLVPSIRLISQNQTSKDKILRLDKTKWKSGLILKGSMVGILDVIERCESVILLPERKKSCTTESREDNIENPALSFY